jgi:hypothetical protein
MSVINGILDKFFSALLWPFRGVPPMVPLAVLALLTAVGMLWIFKKTSNQQRIALVKRKIHACIFEIRLFNDDLPAILRAQARILRATLAYAGLSLVPLIWMILPFILIVAQLQARWGWDGLPAGSSTLVKVHLADDWRQHPSLGGSDRPPLELSVPDGLQVETAVWIPSQNELDWRIAAGRSGRYEIRVGAGEESWTKEVYVAGERGARSPVRKQFNLIHQLLYPAEGSLPGTSPIQSIQVHYPNRSMSFLGLHLHWLIGYLVLSILFGFALKGRMGVTI